MDAVSIKHRPELDGLRAIAVLAVIFYHAGFGLVKGGFVGVDVFFVLSGYLITTIILKEHEWAEFTLFKFYERRIRRILPMLFLTILVCYLTAYFVCTEKEFIYFAKSALLASLGLSNFLFAAEKPYFDNETDHSPLVHTWTLAVEEQFYVIVPLVFMLLYRFGKRTVLAVIVLIAFASFILTFVDFDLNFKFYMLSTRFWELAVGSITSFLPVRNNSYIFSNVFSFTGITFILIAVFSFNESMPNPSYFTLIPTIGTSLVIIFARNESNIIVRLLSLKPVVWIGLISYSVYLIHQPVFAFYRLRNLNGLDNNFECLQLIILILAFSRFTWSFVENPFRKRDQISLQVIFACTFVYFLLTRIDFVSILIRKDLTFRPKFELVSRRDDEKSILSNIVYTNTSIPGDYVFTKMPSDDQFEFGLNTAIGEQCYTHHAYGSAHTQPQLCRVGRDNSSSPVYFLFGDSLAMALVNIFRQLDTPGMFAAHRGGSCKPMLPLDMSEISNASFSSKGKFFLNKF
jgi:peptidoglycan/LPS O-acetylase OafA/YrhL